MDGNMQQPERPAEAPRAPQPRGTEPLLSEFLALMTSSSTVDASLGNMASFAFAQQVSRLVADMDSGNFQTRERATEAVQRMGMSVAPALGNFLDRGNLTLEQTRRIEGSLDRIVRHEPLQSLFSQLTNDPNPGRLQRLIRSHVSSRLERNQPY